MAKFRGRGKAEFAAQFRFCPTCDRTSYRRVICFAAKWGRRANMVPTETRLGGSISSADAFSVRWREIVSGRGGKNGLYIYRWSVKSNCVFFLIYERIYVCLAISFPVLSQRMYLNLASSLDFFVLLFADNYNVYIVV